MPLPLSRKSSRAQSSGGITAPNVALVAATNSPARFQTGADYVMTGNPATDGPIVRAIAAAQAVKFAPGLFVLNEEAAFTLGVKACLRIYPGKPVEALEPGTVTIQRQGGTLVNSVENPLNFLHPVACNLSASTSAGTGGVIDNDIRTNGIAWDWNRAAQGSGCFDVAPCLMLSSADGIDVRDTLVKNWRATGGASSASLKQTNVTSDGSTTLTKTSGTDLVAGDIGHAIAGGLVGVTGTVTITNVIGAGVGQQIVVSTPIPAGGPYQVITSNTATFRFEKWGLFNFYVKDGLYVDIESFGGGTGVNFLYSTQGRFRSIYSHDNDYNGLGAHSSEDVSYIGVKIQSNGSNGMLMEQSRDISITDLLSGGRTSFYTTKFDNPINTSLGNGGVGLNLDSSEAVTVTNAQCINNVGVNAHGFQFQDAANAEGPTLTPGKYLVTNSHAEGNGGKGYNLLNTAGQVTKLIAWRSENNAQDIFITGPGGFNFATPTGGMIPTAKVPAMPASGATIINPFPWTMSVVFVGGTLVAPTVDGIATGNATAKVEPGGVIGPGAYGVAPTWVWATV